MRDGVPRLGRCGVVLAGVLAGLPAQNGSVGRDEESFHVAIGLVRRGLHDDAAEQLRAFLRKSPDHRLAREAWYRLGVCCQELGQTEPAAQAFGKALEGQGRFELQPECRYRLGNSLKELGKLEPAQRQYRALGEEVPADHYLAVPALYAEGECLRDLARTEEALASFRAAAEGAARGAGDGEGGYGVAALYQAGFALLKLERFAEASEAFAAGAERDPQHAAALECRYLAGDAAFRAGDTKRAAAAYAEVQRAGGALADDALLGLGWCAVEEEREADALARFRQLVREAPGSEHAPRARLEAGRILYRRGDVDEAIAELTPLVKAETEPSIRAGALELQGLALLDKKDGKLAATCFEQALRASEDEALQARLYHGLGEALAEQEQWQPALAAYEQAAQRAPDDALAGDALYGQSLALHKLGRFDESSARARALLERAPQHRLAGHARLSVAENLFAQKQYAPADEAYATVPEGHALADRAAFKRAWCAFLTGRHADAAQRFAALAQPEAESAFAEEALSMAALGQLNAGEADAALAAADTYRARYGADGAFLARTERVAARVLRERGDRAGAARRLAAAAQAEGSEQQQALDVLEQAELAFEQGDFAGAAQLYGPLAARDDRTGAQARGGLAWCAFELGDDAACVQHAQAALAHPEVGDAKAGLLELQIAAHHRAEQWAEAQRVARAFLAQLPDHPQRGEITFGLGVAQARAGDDAGACATFTELAQQGELAQPERLLYELAWACRREGDEEAALAAFAEVAEVGEDEDRVGEARLHLGLARLEAKDAKAARTLLAQVRGRYRSQALYRLGFSWLEDGEPAQALAAFDEILARGDGEPLYGEALFFAAESHRRLEQHDEAARRYLELLQKAPEHERSTLARLHGGESLVLLARANEAAPLLEQYLQQGGGTKAEQAEAHLWLGRARAARGELERAEAAYLETTKLSEGELAAEAQFRIGEARRARGDLDGAVDAFVKLSILYGHEEWVAPGLLQAGLCYEELQQPHKAAKFFEELVERFPERAEAAQARARLDKLEVR